VRTVSLTSALITGSAVLRVRPDHASENLPLVPFASHGANDALNLPMSPGNNPSSLAYGIERPDQFRVLTSLRGFELSSVIAPVFCSICTSRSTAEAWCPGARWE